MLVADKDPLRNHAMHALADIDDLRHTTVPHDRGERVRLLAAHRDDLLAGEPMNGLLDGDFHRLIQILVVTHEDPVRLRFRPWPVRLQVLAHDWPNLDFLVGTLEGRQVYLTVSLPAVGIAGPDQATLEKHRQIQRRTGLQLVQIHVRAVFPGPQRTGAPFRIVYRRPGLGVRFVRVDPDRSGEGLQIDHDSRFELRLHLDQIELVVANESFGEFWRKQTHGREILARQVEVESVGFGNDLEYANLQCIAGLRP